MQSLLAGDVQRIRRDAPRVFAIYRRGIGAEMKNLPLQRRTLALIAVIVPLLVLLVYVALRSGPLAPVAVTETWVESRAIHPELFGIGTVEARYTYKIGPTYAGRIKRLDVQVGIALRPARCSEKWIRSISMTGLVWDAALKRAEATIREAMARQSFAETQARRYEQLFAARSASEALVTKRRELAIADAALAAARKTGPHPLRP